MGKFKLAAEFFGTMIFAFIYLLIGNPLTSGLTLTGLLFLFGKISGGHFNPAVSVMMAAAGKIPMGELAPYSVAQTMGTMVALELYKRVMRGPYWGAVGNSRNLQLTNSSF